MPEVAKKRTVRRVRSVASAVKSAGSAPCGHEGTCNAAGCRVRYVGPVSQMGDHHSLVAARASSHAWSAAIITGLAIVVTGAVAFQSVEASQTQRSAALTKQSANRSDIAELKEILRRIDDKLDRVLGTVPKPTEAELLEKVMPKEGSAIPKNSLPENE